ncbi:MAG: chemotaxis protein CheW [Candidatus Marinarcus sp.]|uniref:chemotaxis protein CheW n=1 Tax=Candidatus Marinarcus sp. TaxID=3100987 RepID=UPI003B00F16D
MNNTIHYKGVDIDANIAKFIKHMDLVEEYREELVSLAKSWDNLALLSHFGNSSTNINETKNNFLDLTSTLLNHLSSEVLEKTTREMKFKAQISIDILIRNLFERTADIGFLSTDQDIRNFLLENNTKYSSSYLEKVKTIEQRFKEYIQKYSVYYNIVLMDIHGNILVQLDNENRIEKSKDEVITYALNCHEDYIETFKYHDFIPNREKSLVYTMPVKESDSAQSKTIGILSLCFRFKDEMKSIFGNLVNVNNKECLTILDKDGLVIASSDTDHIRLGTKLSFKLNEKYQVISFGGRDYLAKTCRTNGYQGYMGQEWYGHIMIPIDYAFVQSEDHMNINQNILLAILQEGQGFNDELKKIPLSANKIQSNLNRLVWNGNINKNCSDNSNRNFSRALLSEISSTGEKTKKIFDLSIANLTKTIILNNSAYIASLMVDIMDRNLYERANDCRWWALTNDFKKILSSNELDENAHDRIEKILKYINSLYTVYSNLFVYDNNGFILAVSNDKYKGFIGKQLGSNIIKQTHELKGSNDYFVSKFNKTKLYDDDYTYVYYASIQNEEKSVGGIGVVFDSRIEFKAMIEESIPGFDAAKSSEIFGVYTNKDKMIISSSNPHLKVGEILPLNEKFFNLQHGESHSEIIVYDNKYYALGIKCSQGYREYKTSDGYENDVYAIFFSYLSSGDLKISNEREIFTERPSMTHENTKELATFFIGGKWLGVHIEDVIETVGIEKMNLSPTLNNNHHFKGTVVYENKAVAVIDIKSFIEESQQEEKYKEIVIVKNFDEKSEHYIGILVNSLGDIPEVAQSRIKSIDNHILGKSSLITSIVTPLENIKYNKLLSVLDIKKLKDNLTK